MITDQQINQQIAELNDTVCCTLRPSPIHGIGVFALRDIKQGELVHCAFQPRQLYAIPYDRFDEIRQEIRHLIVERYPYVLEGMSFMSPNDDQIFGTYTNHSDNPNYDPITDKALKDIKEGEEVVENYRGFPRFSELYPFIHTL